MQHYTFHSGATPSATLAQVLVDGTHYCTRQIGFGYLDVDGFGVGNPEIKVFHDSLTPSITLTKSTLDGSHNGAFQIGQGYWRSWGYASDRGVIGKFLGSTLYFVGYSIRKLNAIFTVIVIAALNLAGNVFKSTVRPFTPSVSFRSDFFGNPSTIQAIRIFLSSLINFTGAVPSKRSGRTIGAILSFIGGFQRPPKTKTLTAVLNFVGVFTKRARKTFTGLVSFTTSFVNRGKLFTANLNFTGTSIRIRGKVFAPVLSFVVIIKKFSPRTLSSSLSFTTRIFHSIPTFVQSLTATLSFSGFFAAGRKVPRTLTAALSFIGSILKRDNKALTATSYFGSATPPVIAGLKLWLKADAIGLSDGTAVTTWSDQSGSNNDATQSTALNKPVFHTNVINGLPAVQFDGAASYMTFGISPISGQPASVFVVIQPTVSGSSQISFSTIIIDSPSNGFFLCAKTNATNNWGSFTSVELSSGQTLIANTAYLLETTAANVSTFLYQNGTQVASIGQTEAGASQAPPAIGQDIRAVAPNRWYKGYIAEIVVYNSVLSLANRTAIERYLMVKYGIPVVPSLTIRTLKAIAGVISYVGSFTPFRPGFQMALTAALSFSGNIIRDARRSISGTLSFSGKMVRQLPRLLTAALSFVGTFTGVKPILKLITAALSFVGSLSPRKIFAAILNFSGKVTRSISHQFASSLSFTGTFTRARPKIFTAALSFIGSFTSTKPVRQLLTAALSFVGKLNIGRKVTMTAAVSFIGFIARKWNNTFFTVLTASTSFIGTIKFNRPYKVLLASVIRCRAILIHNWERLQTNIIVSINSVLQYVIGLGSNVTKGQLVLNQQTITSTPTPIALDSLSGRPLSSLFLKNLDSVTSVEIDTSASFNQFPQLIKPKRGVFLSPDTSSTIYARTSGLAADIQIIAGG